MKINTKNFGEIEIEDEKILDFPAGIMGFEDMKTFTLIYDSEKPDKRNVMWLQSIEEPGFAMPVVNPGYVIENYNPTVEDELLKGIGECAQEDMLVLTTLTVPSDITKMTANLKAPIIINSITKKGCQIIVENDEYKVKHEVYEYLKKMKESVGE